MVYILAIILAVAAFTIMEAKAATSYVPGSGSGSGSITVDGIVLSYTWGSKFISNWDGTGTGDGDSTENGSVTFDVSDGTISMTATASKYTYTKLLFIQYDKYAQDSQVWVSFQNNDIQGRTLDITYESTGSIKTPNNTPVTGTIRLAYGESFPDLASAMGFNVIHDVTKTSTSTTGVSGTITITKIEVVQEIDLNLYSSKIGSYTYQVGDAEAMTMAVNGAVVTPNVSMGDTIVLKATGTDTHDFYGWMQNGNLLSTASPYTMTVNASMNVYPVFLTKGFSTTGPFQVGETRYMFWHQAAAQAKAASTTLIIAEEYTLPTSLEENGLHDCVDTSVYNQYYDGAGTYTVPSGVILLIPRDSANTPYTTVPAYVRDDNTQPSAFRELTMANGTAITVESGGAISVAGRQNISQTYGYNGTTSGPSGYIKMESGSSITVKGGAFLYAWGYIYGSGSVTVESNGTVYESFQVRDYRGGDATSTIAGNASTWRLFPMMQYYVQNVEVPMTLKAGAIEKAVMSVYASGFVKQAEIPFVGTDSMFNITSGYVVKDYIESEDRLNVEIHGDLTMSSWNFEIKVALVGDLTLKSEDYVLPINHNITIDLAENSNLSIAQDIGLLPGAEILIQEGATCTLSSGAEIYVYDNLDWGKYCGEKMLASGCTSEDDTTLKPLLYVASGSPLVNRWTEDLTKLQGASILINGKLDATDGYIYTSQNGANIYSTATGEVILGSVGESSTYQVTQNGTSVTETTIVFPGTELKNGDGTYVYSQVDTYTYCSECLRWLCDENHTHAVNHATNVELGNSLNMYFAFWGTGITTDSIGNYRVVVSHMPVGATEPTTYEFAGEASEWQTTSIKINDTTTVTAFVVRYPGLAAKQMSDIVTVTLQKATKDDAGNITYTAVDTWCNSIRNYSMRMLSQHSDNEKLRTLIVDMLNYGAACQEQFAYDTGNLANSLLTAEQQAWATETITWTPDENMPNGSDSYLVNLITTSNIRFAVSNATDSMTYTFTNHWGTEKKDLSLAYQEPVGEESGYSYINTLVVADAKQVITFSNGVKDSIEAYCKRKIDANEDTNGVFTAFMKFAGSAEAYLEGGNRV